MHAIWAILTKNKKGYAKHPETLRWKNKLRALYLRHKKLDKEMKKRGYKHNSPLNSKLARGSKMQNKFVDSYSDQVKILRRKKCGCKV